MHLRQRVDSAGKKFCRTRAQPLVQRRPSLVVSSRLHNRDAVLELLSPFIHLCTTHTPVTVLNSHPTMNLYRFHAFAKQKSQHFAALA